MKTATKTKKSLLAMFVHNVSTSVLVQIKTVYKLILAQSHFEAQW